jgi:hypothetical protein
MLTANNQMQAGDPMMRIFEKRRLIMALFAINLLVIALAYGVFIIYPHYSCDTYSALSPHDLVEVNIRNGRFVHYLYYSFLEAIDCDLPQHLRVTQVLLTGICALGTSVLTERFYRLVAKESLLILALLDISMLLMVINPYFVSGWYYWPETCAGASMGVLFTFLSLMAWCSPEKTIKRRIICIVLLALAVCMYQVYLEFFLGGAVSYTLLEHSYKASRLVLLDMLSALFFCAIAGVVDLVAIHIMSTLGGVVMARTPFNGIGMRTRLHDTWVSQYDASVNMYDMLPSGFLILIVAFFAIGAAVLRIRNHERMHVADIVLTILGFCIVYAAMFVPELLSHNDPVPRLFVGVFTLPLFAACFYVHAARHSLFGVSVGALVIFMSLLVLISCLLKLQVDTIRCNAFDDAQLDAMIEMLDDYEESSGERVDSIRYCYDATGSDVVPGVAPVYDMNVRNMRVPWFFSWAIRDRLGNRGMDMSIAEMAHSSQQDIFGDADWDWFNPSAQIVFDGSVMYIALY